MLANTLRRVRPLSYASSSPFPTLFKSLLPLPVCSVKPLAPSFSTVNARSRRSKAGIDRYLTPSTVIDESDSMASKADSNFEQYELLREQQEQNQQKEQQKQQKQYQQYEYYRRYGRLAPFVIYRRPLAWAAGIVFVVYLTHLERAPISGRWRFMLTPRWLELYVGDQGYQQTMQEFGPHLLSEYHPTTLFVKKTMQRIIDVSQITDVDWKVHVVRGDFPPNAFVLPGGKVFVFESILPICKDQDGLATVLSHETAHQVCRHTAETLSKMPVRWALAVAVYMITGVGSLENIVMQLAFELPASRTMESEADAVGLVMMAEACFRPEAAVGLWQRMLKMEQDSGQQVPEILSTHPASQHRIESIRAELPKVDAIRSEHCDHFQKFRAAVK